MNEDRAAVLAGLEKTLFYEFRDLDLLDHALTHRSFANEFTSPGMRDNERLEFLGDAVLDLCVSDLLMKRFPDDPEGLLSKKRAACVNERSLAALAQRCRLGEGLLLGKGEEQTGGRAKPSLLANAFEAVVAAIYLDGGFERASSFIAHLFTDLIRDGAEGLPYRDYKTLLQEACQNRFHETPHYIVVQESGPDHDKTFAVRLDVADQITTTGTGKSRKEAEQEAARQALACLKEVSPSVKAPGKGVV